MELRQLRYFVAVAEEMHFRRAAERLRLAQPSLSQQIQQLEEELGAQLFERRTRSIALTAAGSRLLLRARIILGNVDDAAREVQQVAQGLTGTLSIAFVSAALVGVLPRILRAFTARVPKVEIRLDEVDPEEQLLHIIRETTDVGFLHGVIHNPHLESMPVQRETLIVALPQELAPRGAVDLRRFAEHTLIVPAAFSGYGYYTHVHRAYEVAGVQPQRMMHTKLLITGLHLVASGLGISLVPACFRTVRVHGVAYRALNVPPPPVDLVAVWRRDSPSKLLQQFLRLAREKCSLAPE